MNEEELVPGKPYWIKTRAKLLSGTIEKPNHLLNINTLEKCEASTLALNEIGSVFVILIKMLHLNLIMKIHI